MRRQQPPLPTTPATERSRLKEEMLLAWNTADVTSINTLSHLFLERGKPETPCFSIPPQGHAVDVRDLSEEQRIDLDEAVVGLIKAMAADSGEAILKYMESRRKVFSPESAAGWRRTLVEHYNFELSSVDVMSDSAVFLASRGAVGNASHWSEVAVKESCCTVWTSSTISAKELRDPSTLSKALFEVFQGYRSWSDNFVSAGSNQLENVSARHEETLIADARVLVEHDAGHLHQRAPYLVRLWYHPDHRRWQPIALLRIDTFDDGPLELTF